MPHSVLRRVPAVALSGALSGAFALAALTATAPGAVASPAATAPHQAAGTPALKVLTYNTFLFSKIA